ncbi:hypothetical protein D0Y65_004518 [Glycine soja]|uniref:Transmembrane protein n=1 Tax=Glycine soja TaxID=3848 RepID=A0A445LRN8_GLYSO|nr:hypothetical protein D0Y65_004518 [Glycine soja]
MVVWSYPPTARQMAVTGGVFVVGGLLFGVGAYFSFVNVAPQQERLKSRREAMRNYIKKRFGDSISGDAFLAAWRAYREKEREVVMVGHLGNRIMVPVVPTGMMLFLMMLKLVLNMLGT